MQHMNGNWGNLGKPGGKGWRESTLSPDVGTAAHSILFWVCGRACVPSTQQHTVSFAGCVAEPVIPALGKLEERITS